MADNTVVIEATLYEEAAELVRTTGAFASVDEYVNFVLAELFGRPEGREADAAEEAGIQKRLKDLGYL